MISVRPDPKHPRGGYAVLSLPESEISGDATQVAVFDNYAERFLGEVGWQPTKVLFGPYDVSRNGGQAELIVGPEIVNQIEEYATIKLMVGDTEHDLSWPDDVVPAPGAAKIGGILGTALDNKPKSQLSAKLPEPKEAPVPEPDPTPPTDRTEISIEPPIEVAPKRGKRGLVLAFILLAIIAGAAAAAFWVLSSDDSTTVEDPGPCELQTLQAMTSFASQVSALRKCGSNTSADTALGLVERAATAGDADALFLFGTFYDAQVTDAEFEEQIGVTFEDTPATAAEYYSRAVSAGSDEARERLSALCERMGSMSDTLVQGALADYCGN